jgi:hypothetical protein
MFKKALKSLMGAITTKLLASVNFWNFQESVLTRLEAIESRLEAIESRLEAIESRLEAIESRLYGTDTRLDKSENRLNANENRIDLIENPLNIHRGVLETFYDPMNANKTVVDFALQLKKILTLSQQIDAKLARFGDDGDGGYVIVDDLRSSDVLFSIGVGGNISFDKKCEIFVSKVVLVDHTVPNFYPPTGNFEMIRKPLVPGDTPETGVTINQLIERHPNAEDYILKVDIEGDEWRIFSELNSSQILKFRQIILELHGLNSFVDLHGKLSVLEKLASTHTPIVLHANNQGSHRFISGKFIPDVLEVTWVRTNSYSFHSELKEDTRKLLSPNSPHLPNIWIDWIDGNPEINA